VSDVISLVAFSATVAPWPLQAPQPLNLAAACGACIYVSLVGFDEVLLLCAATHLKFPIEQFRVAVAPALLMEEGVGHLMQERLYDGFPSILLQERQGKCYLLEPEVDAPVGAHLVPAETQTVLSNRSAEALGIEAVEFLTEADVKVFNLIKHWRIYTAPRHKIAIRGRFRTPALTCLIIQAT
jgi:hypothetical protein